MSFHDPLVGPEPTGLPEGFFDRFVFNLHPPDATVPSVLLGFGCYPARDVADGFAVLVTGSEQRNVRFSTELSATDGAGAGPFAFEVVEPMRTWRLALAPNPTGLELDVVWQARAPAWHGRVGVRAGDVETAAFDHLFQSGRYTGTLAVDGVRQQVDGWYGQRDRSRGMRTMAGGQGLHLWVQVQLEDRSVGFLLVEDRAQQRLLLEGAVMHEDGRLDPVVDVRHALRFTAGLDLEGGTFEVTTASGVRYVLDADGSAGGGFMAGAGYGGHHGKVLGRDHLEHDRYPLDGSVTPRTLDSALTDRLASFTTRDGRTGVGVLEFAHSRSHSYAYRPTLT